MKNYQSILLFVILFLALSAFQNGSDSFLPKHKADNILISEGMDTLRIVTTLPFCYYPFGESKSISLFRLYNKKKYDIKIEVSKYGKLYSSSIKGSFVKYFLSTEANSDLLKVQIISATITNPAYQLVNGFKIGMSKSELLNWYFIKPKEDLIKKYKVVVFESGLTGIWHYYNFENDKLVKIEFDSDYQLNKKQ